MKTHITINGRSFYAKVIPNGFSSPCGFSGYFGTRFFYAGDLWELAVGKGTKGSKATGTWTALPMAIVASGRRNRLVFRADDDAALRDSDFIDEQAQCTH